jgi:3-oxoacyl-[acyl-carrier-protein] synthase II
VIPPTINYANPDPECDHDNTPNTAAHREVEVALSNSFGFGGHNVALAVRKYRE